MGFKYKAKHCIVNNLAFCAVKPFHDPYTGPSIDLKSVPDFLSWDKKRLSWGFIGISPCLCFLCDKSADMLWMGLGGGTLTEWHQWAAGSRALVRDSAPLSPLFINKRCSVTVYTQQRGCPIRLGRAWRMIWPVRPAVTLHTVVIPCVDSKAFL